MKSYIGIDPGQSGGIAIVGDGEAHAWKMPETERDIWDTICSLKKWNDGTTVAVIEKVHAMPKQGVTSTFTFGSGYGGLRMALIAAGIPFIEVTPQRWQKDMECRTGGDKNVSKAKAQQLYPAMKITHALADALLIATWLRNQKTSPFCPESSTESRHAEAQSHSESKADVPEEPPAPVKKKEGFADGNSSTLIPTTPQAIRIANIFHRKLTTAWQPSEVTAYKRLGVIPEDDLAAVERHYASQWPPRRDVNILRHDLITFLNNFPGEVDRAHAAKTPAAPKTPPPPAEHPQWRPWLKLRNLPYVRQSDALPFQREEFGKWKDSGSIGGQPSTQVRLSVA